MFTFFSHIKSGNTKLVGKTKEVTPLLCHYGKPLGVSELDVVQGVVARPVVVGRYRDLDPKPSSELVFRSFHSFHTAIFFPTSNQETLSCLPTNTGLAKTSWTTSSSTTHMGGS